MPIVTLVLTSDDPSPIPLEGVVVEFYDTGAVFQTSGTSDVDGEVVVTLPDASYDVLFYKVGVTILPSQPQRIVVDSLLTNTFSIVGHVRTTPESTDPLRCTVSGYLLGVDGKQARHRLIFEPVKALLVLSGNVIAPYSRVEVTSDEEGYFQFELLRDTKYTGYFVFPQDLFCQQPGKLNIVTPDLPAVALSDLLFPIPITLSFSPLTISLVAGGQSDTSITVSMTFTDGSERTTLSTPWAGVTLQNSDPTIVAADLLDGLLSLKPLAAGTATITTVREVPSSVTIDPLPDFVSQSVVVTVS